MRAAIKASGSSTMNHAHKLSVLAALDATLQPVGRAPSLRAEVDRLAKSEDVRALVALYEAYVASAMAFQSLENQPRSSGTRAFLEWECAHAWSKAFYVADRLKTIRPYEGDDLERYAATLFNCMLAMGNSLDEAGAVVNEINAWPKIERPTRR
jgi:hypothetical protein